VNPSSSGALYRRTVFERIGYYDERFDACEDVEFNHRVLEAGLSSYLSPRLAVFYQPRPSVSGLWRQMVRYGRGRFQLIRKHPCAFSLSQLIPAGLLIWLIVGGIAALLSVKFAPYYLGGVTIYVAAILGFSIALGCRYGWRHLLQAPYVYLVIHFGLAIGFLTELLDAISRSSRRSGRVADSGSVLHDSATTSRLSGAKSGPRAEGS
jgi:cellulose synthase/poly-beta-1,6-N-acetylglucosamine synthase-like glycosyltransferase